MKIEIKKNKKKKTWSYGEDSPVFSWLRHNKKKKKGNFKIQTPPSPSLTKIK